ncbi:MAG: hypothetical protein RBS88_01860 [Spongiibacteraceae bacterium]|jgi:hypothetical protein|nr:hypothetical protein [Spongiibacteraceae bacterium]
MSTVIPSGCSGDAPTVLRDQELKSRFVGAMLDDTGREIPITEEMITQALLSLDGLTCPASRNPSASSVPR